MGKAVKLKIDVIIVDQVTTTKTAYTNILILSINQPTIAYRPNRLGINVEQPVNNTVLDIYPNSENQYINLNSMFGNIIQIDLLNNIIDII